MSVIGIDFGTDNCYIACARQGGIETIANDYSLRATPSCVAFGEKNRILGVAAKNQMMTNMKNTVYGMKRLLGRNYKDPRVSAEVPRLTYRTVEASDGSVGIVVRYSGEELTFSPTQLSAMLFTKLKQTAETALNIKVVDVVIGVPCYFSEYERRALLNAATTAGLNVLRLMNETTATALAYGIYKQDLPAPEEKPRHVVFVDAGYANLQTSVVAFHKGKLKMLASNADPNLGGRDIDLLLATHFAQEFKTRYKIDACNNPRAFSRLLTEVEKIKKQMSANSTDLPINIECFMDDKDVSAKLNRAAMEEMAGGIWERVESVLQGVLADSGLKLEDIHSVEIVGGSSRIPRIKQIIEKVFHKPASTMLNQDEAVSRGCALQCAMLSPTFKVRDFSITDVQPYSIRLGWTDDQGLRGDMEVFPKNHPVPFSKMLTFYRRSAFSLEAAYTDPAVFPDAAIGAYTVQGVVPQPDGQNAKVKVKVRVNLHGLFTVSSASLTEKKEALPEEPPAAAAPAGDMETSEEKKENDAENKPPPADQPPNSPDANAEEQKMDTEKAASGESPAPPAEKKKVVKSVELPVSESIRGLTTAQLNCFVEKECQMVAADRLENERINARNAVEEYVYEVRGKLCDELERYVGEKEREELSGLLEDTENWLYEDGEDCLKQVYIDKLAELQKKGEPIKSRRREREELPMAFEGLLASVQLARKAVDLCRAGDDKYQHLDPQEVDKVDKAISDKQAWVDKQMGAISSTPLHANVPITAQQVRSEKGLFDAVVNPILNKPKPKVEEPPAPAADKPEEGNAAPEAPEGAQPQEGAAPQADKPHEPMDVD